MPLSVPRENLIAALEESRDAKTAPLQEVVDKYQKELDDLEAGIQSPVEWLRAIADGVDAGKFFLESNGQWFAVGWEDDYEPAEDEEIPEFTDNTRRVESAKERLQRAQLKIAEAAAPFEAALKVLNMSTDATVEVHGDYTKLLSE